VVLCGTFAVITSAVSFPGWSGDLWLLCYTVFPCLLCLYSWNFCTQSLFSLVSDTGHKCAPLWIIWTGYEPCTPGTLGLPFRPPSCSCATFYSCYINLHTPSLCSSLRTRSPAFPSHPQSIPVLITDESTSSLTPSFPKLSSSNYLTWKGEMKAFLCTKGLWTIAIVSGAEKHPDDSQSDLQTKWDLRADKAAGQLYLSLSAEQRTHIDAVQDHPVQMWSTLESLHLQQCPGACLNAWDDFFSIRKKQDKSLTSLITRIEDSMSKIQQLCPKDAITPYTIKDLDNELICMAMVRSLGDEYSHFVSSLLRKSSWWMNYSACGVLSWLLHLRLSCSRLAAPASVPLLFCALSASTPTTVSISAKIWPRLSPTTFPRSLSALRKEVMLKIRPLMPLTPPRHLLSHPLAPSPLPRPWSSLEMQVFVPLTPPLLCIPLNSMLMSIRMQTLGPLLIWPPIATGSAIILQNVSLWSWQITKSSIQPGWGQ